MYAPIRNLLFVATVASLAGAPLAALANDGTLYKWIDDNGVVHYGDTVPAEYVKRERQVINEHAVTMETLPAQKTDAEIAAEAEARKAQKIAEKKAAEQAERDRILLNTYLSVAEIEMLRDRRIQALEAQIALTQHYINNLQERAERLNALAEPFDRKGEPLPDRLGRDVETTQKNLDTYRRALSALRSEQGGIREQFAQDMDRFQSLKGVN